ncbi:isoleucyl-tRNA synthetase [Plasmodium falciparum IGH-CR14]|uniref:Isoleucyl-tRNA synthetase n=1 Tax=Plasmodium falciparum IGH-CR14 TaxID=580059 RepID=A0A0L1IE20_PLAFA|nr:isoleucyl-tRNA synthetase [Plasmodium falciparum IGH-CR14]
MFKYGNFIVIIFLIFLSLIIELYLSLHIQKKHIPLDNKNNSFLQFINSEHYKYKHNNKYQLNQHKKNIKDVIKESINLPLQFLPTTYNSLDRQKFIQQFWNCKEIYEKRNFENIKKHIYNNGNNTKQSKYIQHNNTQSCNEHNILNKKKKKEKETYSDVMETKNSHLIKELIEKKKKLISKIDDNNNNNNRKHIFKYIKTKDYINCHNGNHLINKFENIIYEKIKNEKYLKKNKKEILLKLYNKILNKIKIIHDGPPYANNDIHIGHILNKVIKDIYLKYFLFQNYFVLLIHGFDTHGLPIEYNVMKLLKINHIQDLNLNSSYIHNQNESLKNEHVFFKSYINLLNKLKNQHKKKKQISFLSNIFEKNNIISKDTIEQQKISTFKNLCKSYASYFVNEQFMSLVSYGIWGYWNYTYITFYKFYEQIQNKVFRDLLKNKYIYMSNRPIYHSYATKTVLSDSEIIYKKREFKENKAINEILEFNQDDVTYFLENYSLVINEIIKNNKENNEGKNILNGNDLFNETNSNDSYLEGQHISNYILKLKNQIIEKIIKKVKILVLTTQMHTIFNNKCLLIHEKYLYRIIHLKYEDEKENQFFIICDKSYNSFSDNLTKYYSKKSPIKEIKNICTFQGNSFMSCTYKNFTNNEENNFIFVSDNEIKESFGTGIVHVAPSHGFTDYNFYYKNNKLKKIYLDISNYQEIEEKKQTRDNNKINISCNDMKAEVSKKIFNENYFIKNNSLSLDVINENVMDENDDLKDEYTELVYKNLEKNIHFIKKYETPSNAQSLLNSLDIMKKKTKKLNINEKDIHSLFFYSFYENILFYFPYEHSYTYDWRSHTTVQIKSLLQIYVDIDKIKNNIPFYQSIKNIHFINKHVKNNLIKTIKDRNEWCISRQKYWGVNIPLKDIELDQNQKIIFNNQIMDVWFDSSVSYIYVLYMCKHILFHTYFNKIWKSVKNYNNTYQKGKGKYKNKINYNNKNENKLSFNIYDVYDQIMNHDEYNIRSMENKDNILLKNILQKKKIFDTSKMYKWINKQIQKGQQKKYYSFQWNSIKDIVFSKNNKKEFFKKHFNIFLCCEGIDQIRGWFQSFFFVFFCLNWINQRKKTRSQLLKNTDKIIDKKGVVIIKREQIKNNIKHYTLNNNNNNDNNNNNNSIFSDDSLCFNNTSSIETNSKRLPSHSYLPIKNVIVHNYVVDSNNIKMSKSLNNVISPRELFFEKEKDDIPTTSKRKDTQKPDDLNKNTDINNKGNINNNVNNNNDILMKTGKQIDLIKKKNKNKDLNKRFNADIVRLWVCCYNFVNRNISISYEILENINKYIYLKLYNTFKFIMNNIYDLNFDGTKDNMKIKWDNIQMIDKFILYKKDNLIKHCTKAYKNFQLQLLIKYIMNFIYTDLAIYIDYSKDRLYIHEKNSLNRTNCQKILYKILRDLIILLGPIVPHLSEDIYYNLQLLKNKTKRKYMTTHNNNNNNNISINEGKIKSLFLRPFPKFKNYKQVNLDTLFLIKYYIHKQISPYFSNSLQAIVYIFSNNDNIINLIKSFLRTPDPLEQFNNYDDLRFLFNVSNIFICDNICQVEEKDKNYKTYKIPLPNINEKNQIKNKNKNKKKNLNDFFQPNQKPIVDHMLNFDENIEHAIISIGINKTESKRCSRCWMYGTVYSFEGEYFCPRCLNVIKSHYN